MQVLNAQVYNQRPDQVSFEQLAPMPKALANNAVVEGFDGTQYNMYSFLGIDSSKIWSGISLDAFRFDGTSWSTIAPVPDTLGKIAASASYANGKIYLIGGYHVLSSGAEVSSDRVHIYNPTTESWEADGAPIPIPIDDQVQAVYKDSLIYVITGWSNFGNVAAVQIYDPANDSWQSGTPVSIIGQFRVFGGSGTIIGDTIFYAGGARNGSDFPLSDRLKRGVIDPSDPSQIIWTEQDDINALRYRSGAVSISGYPFWFGGAGVSYNFNGIAYNGSGGVDPLNNVVFRDKKDSTLSIYNNAVLPIPEIMDLRGIAKFDDNNLFIAGGMLEGQEVTDQVWKIIPAWIVGGLGDVNVELNSYPNPVNQWLNVELKGEGLILIYNHAGILCKEAHGWAGNNAVNISALISGLYYLEVSSELGNASTKFIKL
ncbi:MAG: hypothetical protein ACI959_000597 [Limisphaerales bacterium]|jgi:hypothetical protein